MIYEKDFNCINDDEINIETAVETQLVLQNDTVPIVEDDKTAETSKSLKINDDETLLFEQSIQSYNDKIIEVSC